MGIRNWMQGCTIDVLYHTLTGDSGEYRIKEEGRQRTYKRNTMRIKCTSKKGKAGLYEWQKQKTGRGREEEKLHSHKRHRDGEKESGIYLQLSAALKAINTYKASAIWALGQYWSVYVYLCVMDDSSYLCSLPSRCWPCQHLRWL